MGNFLSSRLGIAIRWIIFIPNVFIVLLIFTIFYDYLSIGFLGENISIISSKFFSSILAGHIIHFFAPKHKKRTVLLVLIYSILEPILILTNTFPVPDYKIDSIASVLSCIGYIISIISVYKVNHYQYIWDSEPNNIS